MPLINRLVRLFRADFHAVLDRIEEPDIILRQALREMETALAQGEQQQRQQSQELERLRTRDTELQQSQAALDVELSICLDADNDDLARNLLKRKLENTRVQQLLQQRLLRMQQQFDRRSKALDDDRSRYQGLRDKAALFETRQHGSEPRSANNLWDVADVTVTGDDVEVALLHEKQRRSAS